MIFPGCEDHVTSSITSVIHFVLHQLFSFHEIFPGCEDHINYYVHRPFYTAPLMYFPFTRFFLAVKMNVKNYVRRPFYTATLIFVSRDFSFNYYIRRWQRMTGNSKVRIDKKLGISYKHIFIHIDNFQNLQLKWKFLLSLVDFVCLGLCFSWHVFVYNSLDFWNKIQRTLFKNIYFFRILKLRIYLMVKVNYFFSIRQFFEINLEI